MSSSLLKTILAYSLAFAYAINNAAGAYSGINNFGHAIDSNIDTNSFDKIGSALYMAFSLFVTTSVLASRIQPFAENVEKKAIPYSKEHLCCCCSETPEAQPILDNQEVTVALDVGEQKVVEDEDKPQSNRLFHDTIAFLGGVIGKGIPFAFITVLKLLTLFQLQNRIALTILTAIFGFALCKFVIPPQMGASVAIHNGDQLSWIAALPGKLGSPEKSYRDSLLSNGFGSLFYALTFAAQLIALGAEFSNLYLLTAASAILFIPTYSIYNLSFDSKTRKYYQLAHGEASAGQTNPETLHWLLKPFYKFDSAVTKCDCFCSKDTGKKWGLFLKMQSSVMKAIVGSLGLWLNLKDYSPLTAHFLAWGTLIPTVLCNFGFAMYAREHENDSALTDIIAENGSHNEVIPTRETLQSDQKVSSSDDYYQLRNRGEDFIEERTPNRDFSFSFNPA